MSCDVVPWCTTEHERMADGGWDHEAEDVLVRFHERDASRLVYLVAEERAGGSDAGVGTPLIAVNAEDEHLDPAEARALAADLIRLADLAGGAA